MRDSLTLSSTATSSFDVLPNKKRDDTSDGFMQCCAWAVGWFSQKKFVEEYDDHSYGDGCYSARVGIDALDQPYVLHHLHGDDRQPAIWLDPFRQSDQQSARLVHRLDSGGLRGLHRS